MVNIQGLVLRKAAAIGCLGGVLAVLHPFSHAGVIHYEGVAERDALVLTPVASGHALVEARIASGSPIKLPHLIEVHINSQPASEFNLAAHAYTYSPPESASSSISGTFMLVLALAIGLIWYKTKQLSTK